MPAPAHSPRFRPMLNPCAFVVARINPLRFHKGEKPSFDATLEKMITSAKKFNAGSVKPDQVARAAGPPDE